MRTNYGRYLRVRIREGCEGAGKEGYLYNTVGKNENLKQAWSMVLFDDEEDPRAIKTATLQSVQGEPVLE
jgi:hypothetical protein